MQKKKDLWRMRSDFLELTVLGVFVQRNESESDCSDCVCSFFNILR